MAQMLRVIQEGTKVLDFYCLRIAYYNADLSVDAAL